MHEPSEFAGVAEKQVPLDSTFTVLIILPDPTCCAFAASKQIFFFFFSETNHAAKHAAVVHLPVESRVKAKHQRVNKRYIFNNLSQVTK